MSGPRLRRRIEARSDMSGIVKAGAAQASYLRSALVANPGIMNTMEMANPTIRTVPSAIVFAIALMAMLTTVDPT